MSEGHLGYEVGHGEVAIENGGPHGHDLADFDTGEAPAQPGLLLLRGRGTDHEPADQRQPYAAQAATGYYL